MARRHKATLTLGSGVVKTALEALLEARVWVGRAELCACDVRAGLGLGVALYVKNYSQNG